MSDNVVMVGEFAVPGNLLALARSRSWWPVGRVFKKAFYSTLHFAGAGKGAQEIIGAFLKPTAREIHGLSDDQVYALVGLMRGIVRVESGVAQLRCYRRAFRGNAATDEWKTLDAEVFVDHARPRRATIDREIEWVASQLRVKEKTIDWGSCPSQLAGNLLLDLREPDYAALRMKFWSLLLDKRLQPGDSVRRRRSKAVLEEGESAEDAAVDIEALKARLGMTG